ncbi:MAG: thioredoxin [Marinifilaceae bacterium]|jgi:thioredoxin 1|nr:thioredoxin [Marinifilaceae bacterium]
MSDNVKAIEGTDANIEEILAAGEPVLIDFWAEWCGPCRMLSPVVDELVEDYQGRVKIVKVDVDANPAIAAKYGIRNIPTILFLKNNEIVDKQVGAAAKQALQEKLNAIIAGNSATDAAASPATE